MKEELVVGESAAGERLDKFLSRQLTRLSRTRIYGLVKRGLVLVDGKIKKGSFRLRAGQQISLSREEEKNELKPFEFAVKIIYEDEDIIVVDKPTGLVVHPPQKGYQKTLVNALIYLKKKLYSPAGSLRPGVVHRLDKETSGVMVLAKNRHSYEGLVSQFKARRITKDYRAVVWGAPQKDKMLVDLPLSRDTKNRLKMKVSFLKAKAASTEITIVEALEGATYLRLRPRTGRMHQIRVHLKFLGLPIVGDKKYGVKDKYQELFLHAADLSFTHPGKPENLSFHSELPERFLNFFREHRLRN